MASIMIVITVWIILITVSQHVQSSKVIVVNNNGSAECCINGENCTCNSLTMALQYLENNSIVKITSELVRLDNATAIGSGKVITNITIIGNKTTVDMCKSTASVFCISCVDFVIKGITWDQCGNPNVTDLKGGLNFYISGNITIDNCTFQNSQTCAVYLYEISYNITVKNCYFISNGLRGNASADNVCGGIKIDTAATNTTVMI